ncbi:hypothetical protein AMQ83_29110 [Paenibacillus riograndensis]|nr:hypothetical protein AMQ83_29110 [Paenibacillus riograndensis]
MGDKLIWEPHAVLFPMPTVIISTASEGKETVDACAWLMPVNLDPPMIALALRPKYLSWEYIKQSGEFAVNIPYENQTEFTDYCVRTSGYSEDKLRETGCNVFYGKHIKVPLLSDSIINMECAVKETYEIGGTHSIFVAEILQTYFDEKIVVDRDCDNLNDAVSLQNAKGIAYVMGEYWNLGHCIGLRSE